MATHARLSPSGASGWANCSQWQNGPGSSFARYGTACHDLAARVLTGRTNACDHLGETVEVEGELFTVDQEMVDIVDAYVTDVRAFTMTHQLHVEVAVPIDHITGEPGATGTADAVLLTDDGRDLIVVDLKTGRGVEVEAEGNLQLAMYALGAMANLGARPRTITLAISQPRIVRALSTWQTSIAELLAIGQALSAAASRYGTGDATPSESACRWCAKKATCSALARRVQEQVGADFTDLTTEGAAQDAKVAELVAQVDIAQALTALDLIEDWCAAVRAEAERRLHQGVPVPGFKLVAGKRGARAWSDAAIAERTLLVDLKVPEREAFDRKLISPATAEKVLKGRKAEWAVLQALITQNEGRPTVAPVSDRRPAIEVTPTANLFADETGGDLT